jgi:hypothetical protein
MRHLSAIILLVFLTVMPSCKFLQSKGLFGGKAKKLALLMAQQDSIRVVDSIRKVQDNLMAIEKAKLDSIQRADEERLSLDARLKYNIIVGSFITPEYAKALSEEYRKLGYDPKIIREPGNRFEFVVAEAHNSFRTAVDRLMKFQDTVQIDSWMYIKK